MFRRTLIWIFLVAGLVTLFYVYQKYQTFYGVNVSSELKEKYIQIPTGSSFDEVVNLLMEDGFLIDSLSGL